MEQLLATKFFIPTTRPEIVARPRLIEKLNEGLHHKLILISAPAGFGKTTLLTEWVDNLRGSVPKEKQVETQIVWLSLDESDNDPTRFLVYVISALRASNAIIAKGLLSALQSPQPPPIESTLITLINEITNNPNQVILVLDDFHLINTQSIHDALTFLIEHFPPQLHLVIATREDPHLPLARLRVQSQLTELRASDLRFSVTEVTEFLNQMMGLALSAEDIAALERRTEGWIAGLQLAAISMRGHKDATSFIKSFTGSHRLVLDYLIEEVLEQQPERVQTFLLKTSVLNRLTGSLCDVLTDQENSQGTLEMLDRANLFLIPLDDERLWYRYHHLFAELLRQRLNQIQPELVSMLHQQASEWCEHNGYPDRAIEHSIQAENFERSARLIEEQADVIWGRGEHNQLFRWLERLPNELLLSKPQLCIYSAWCQFLNGQHDATEQSLLATENALSQSVEFTTETVPGKHNERKDASWTKIQGRAATIRAELAFYQGDIPGLIQYANQALEYLPEHDLPWRSAATAALGDAYGLLGELEKAYRVRLDAVQLSEAGHNHYIRLISVMKLVITLRQQGKLQQVVEILQQELQLANESGMAQTDVFGCILAIWGEILAEFHDLERAIDLARRGVDLAERGSDVGLIGWSYLCLMRVLFSRRDFSGVDEIYQKTEKINREVGMPPWITGQVVAWQTRKWLAQGKLDISSQWALEHGLSIDGELTYIRTTEYVVLARLLIAQERLGEASKLLARLFDAAKAGGRVARMIEIWILQALVFQARDDTENAIATIRKAVTLAEPESFVCIFVDEGPAMARLLYETLSHGIAPDYVRRLLAAFPVSEPEGTVPTKPQVDQSELIEPLSEREIEVLQLIAEGLTSREIAARLYLSPNTVKVHSRNINSKLGVNNRVKAVIKARTLGILPFT